MTSGPNNFHAALAKSKEINHDVMGDPVTSDLRLFHEAAPAESGADRLDRYLTFLKKHRPRHIVEICLGEGRYCDQTAWYGPLEERGFKRVTSAMNSNSGHKVHIYHLVIDEEEDD